MVWSQCTGLTGAVRVCSSSISVCSLRLADVSWLVWNTQTHQIQSCRLPASTSSKSPASNSSRAISSSSSISWAVVESDFCDFSECCKVMWKWQRLKMAKILNKEPAVYKKEQDNFLRELRKFHDSKGWVKGSGSCRIVLDQLRVPGVVLSSLASSRRARDLIQCPVLLHILLLQKWRHSCLNYLYSS